MSVTYGQLLYVRSIHEDIKSIKITTTFTLPQEDIMFLDFQNMWVSYPWKWGKILELPHFLFQEYLDVSLYTCIKYSFDSYSITLKINRLKTKK